VARVPSRIAASARAGITAYDPSAIVSYRLFGLHGDERPVGFAVGYKP
jgi:hypothetical protein